MPFYHSNIDNDELLFYHDGDFFSRKGIDKGMATLHPAGVHHGPQPGAAEGAAKKVMTDEVAVMVECLEPLVVSPAAEKASIDASPPLRVCDYGRVDLRLTETGEVYVIEVNASCYLEEQSEFATAAAAHGIPYPELVERIAELAVERWKHRTRAQKRRKKSRTAAAAAATG